jgi:thymidylate synthase (FAD)
MKMLSNGNVMDIENEGDWKLPLDFVNWCARISHRAEDAKNQDVERFLRSVVLQHGDWSVTEHVSISVDAYVDRGITHEIVRHRLAAYTQESTRFVNYAKKMPPSFIYPQVGVECKHCLSGDEPQRYNDRWLHITKLDAADEAEVCAYNARWLNAISTVEHEYKGLIADGWRPQEARSVFPNALASRIIITYNLRQWRLFFLMRTSVEAHPQMRQVTIPLLEDFKKAVPVLYEDIEPNAKQSDNLKKAR